LRAQEDADAVTDLQYREDVEKCDYHVPAPKLEDPRGILYDFWEGMRTMPARSAAEAGLPLRHPQLTFLRSPLLSDTRIGRRRPVAVAL